MLPGVAEACAGLRRAGFVLVVVTNQPDIARGTQSRAEVDRMHQRLRSLVPLDEEAVFESVARTGRAVVVHEASRFCGYGAEVAARLSEQCFHYLEAPVLRVAGFDIPYPPPSLEEYHLPSVDRILAAIDRLQWQETSSLVRAAG